VCRDFRKVPSRVTDAAVVEKPADHVRRDLARALQVKLVSGRRLELSIGAGQRSPETSTDKAVGLDHDHASGLESGSRYVNR
jgi:hypothetical protein